MRLSAVSMEDASGSPVPVLDDMTAEQSLVSELAGESTALEENLFQCHFVHHIPHML
jgi:hypothetical protein